MHAWRTRWQAWWLARHPRTDTLALTHRNLYILPTASGWLFALLLACLLLASINYQLNLGHLLTFALAGAGAVGLHATHATLRGLTLTAREGEPGFVGGTIDIEITLHDGPPIAGWRRPVRFGRHGLGLRWHDSDDVVWTDVADGASTVVRLGRRPVQRGVQTLPPLQIASRFPLGLFRAWAVWRIALQPLAWPEPEDDAPTLPARSATDGDAPSAVRHAAGLREPGDDDGVRPWRREDRLNQVLWKLSARQLAAGGGLLVRDPAPPPQQQELHLDGTRLRDLDPEARLRRLTAWVLAADRDGLRYRLSLPGLRLDAGDGSGQRRRCLDALATWEAP